MAESTFNNPQSYGAFRATTNTLTVQEIYGLSEESEQLQDILVHLLDYLNEINLLLNIKDSGYYNTDEFVTGQIWYPNPTTPTTSFDTSSAIFRQGYRQVVVFDNPLPNVGTVTQPHNITVTPMTKFTKISGASNDHVNLLATSIPNSDIKVTTDATNVIITTTANYSTYTDTSVVLEYVQT